jgi:pimeloyl-ACP methyl ester carboxylesterase
MRRPGNAAGRSLSAVLAAGLFLLLGVPNPVVLQAGAEIAFPGGFTVSYTPSGAGQGYVCTPDSFNGALVLWADFETGALRVALEGGATTASILTHPLTGERRWYRGGIEFRGQASGSFNPTNGRFSLLVSVTGEEGGAWNRERDEYEPEVKAAIRRSVQLTGRISRDGKGGGRIYSDDGPCRMEGDWILRKGGALPPPAPVESAPVESIPKDLAHYRYEMVVPAMTPEPGAPPFQGDSFDELAARRQGELEIIFTYAGQSGRSQEVSFRASLADLAAADGFGEGEKRRRGETILRGGSGRTLVLGHLLLDRLGQLAALPENAGQAVRAGETVFRGGETDFKWRLVLHDGGRIVARSPGSGVLKYLVRYPVVFLPGTAGSRLAVGESGVPDEVWPANLWRGTSLEGDRAYWQRLALDSSGRGTPVTATDIFRYYGQTWQPLLEGLSGVLGRSVTPSVKNVYQGFLEHMASQGYVECARPFDLYGPPPQKDMRLFLFPYDWRLDIESHAPNLDRLVERALDLNYNREAGVAGEDVRPVYRRRPEDKVILIGHSQGALVMRAYAALPERAAKIESMVMLGPPNLGSLNTFRALAGTGYNFEALFLHPEVGKWVGRNWVSPYQMLPFAESGGLASFLLDEEGRPLPDILGLLRSVRTHAFCFWRTPLGGGDCADDLTLNGSLLQAALDFQSRLPNPAALGIPTFIVAGTGQPTITAFRRTSRPVKLDRSGIEITPARTVSRAALEGRLLPEVLWQAEYPVTADDGNEVTVALPYFEEILAACGDGTVPLYSLIGLPGARPIYIAGAKHGSLTENPSVQGILDRLLMGVLPASGPAPACSSTAAGASNGIRVRARCSPAVLHVYDSQGRHSGIAAGGAFEEGIPGSSFHLWGESQDVWLPAGGDAYRVVLEGTRDTAVDLSLVAGDGHTERRADYLNIRESPGLNAEVRFAADTLGPDTPLEIDRDGDRRFDAVRKPDAFQTYTSRTPEALPKKSGGIPSSILIAAAVLLLCSLVALILHGRRKPPAES